jgi:ATP-binding cassette subfamily F protein 3
VAEFQNVSKSYGAKRVLEDVVFLIERGDRIALVGPNGAGKSTLIKLLSGAEPLTAGDYRLGHNVGIDYFAQDQYKELDPDATLLDDLGSLARNKTVTELRTLLGCFLFSDDDVFKRIGVLSGGERNRYALAKMLLNPSNFLLLDEPTNHLDLRAKDVLLNALADFSGTVVFVSHDRYFIDKLATRVFEIGGGQVQIFPGNYEDYLWRKSGKTVDLDLPAAPLNGAAAPVAPAAKDRQQRVNPLKLEKLRQRCQTIEQQIAASEKEIASIEAELTSFRSAEESIRLTQSLDERRASLEKLMTEWEEVSTQIEAGA